MRGTFLLLVLPTLAVTETYQAFSAKKVDIYNNMKISQSEMWTVKDLNRLQCMSECLKEKYCVSFHFSPMGPVCVALRERFEGSSVASTNAPGYQLYQTNKPLAKVASDCELDVDCASLSNSHCRDRVCRCDVGYGIYGDVCRILTECFTFTKHVTVYKSSYVAGYDIQVQRRSTYESCPAFCISNTICQSADFDLHQKICYLNKVTWFASRPYNRKTDRADVDFFQRECLW
ncbi:uncharacterized protein [Haliotis asinina]|uniref:uncharacterized protein n=1 Tax=Haliotis asinina TaxID=109174 RepID=UPI0035321BA4